MLESHSTKLFWQIEIENCLERCISAKTQVGYFSDLYPKLASRPFRPLSTSLLSIRRVVPEPLSKDGSTLLDEGPRTALRYSPFHDLLGGQRWTFFHALLNQQPGREALERRTWAQRAGTALPALLGGHPTASMFSCSETEVAN